MARMVRLLAELVYQVTEVLLAVNFGDSCII
jgi:hypothetical protein